MKREAFRDLLNRRKWEQALFVVERPYRADALAELIEERGVRSLLSAIRYVWSDTESVFSNWQTWEYIWAQAEKTKRGKRRENLIYVMDKPERAFFAALPDKFIVYRGFKKEGGEVGYSWTLDRSMGEWFARRYAYQGQPMLAKMEVNKSDVLAYFNGRKESEIVLHPIVVDFSAVTIKALLPARAEAA